MKLSNMTSTIKNIITSAGTKILCLCFVMLVCVTNISAQPATEIYKHANQLYKANQFDSAAASYEKILAQGYKTTEVYYNLGNCYYKLNNIGKSILCYERAANLAPKDEDIEHNLKLANTRAIDKIVPVPQLGVIQWWNNFIASNSSGGWGTYAMVLAWLALICFIAYLFTTLRTTSLVFGFIFIALSLSCMLFAFKQSSKEQDSNSAILMVANTSVKSAPDANGNDIFMLHEGVKFQVLDCVTDWCKIRLADGKVGWLEKNTFEKI